MTTSYSLEHDFPNVPLDIFEEYLNHSELNKMLTQMPSFKSRELIESQELKNGEKQWCFHVQAGGELPPAIAKIASPDLFAWKERARFVPKEHALYFEIEPFKAKDKFKGSGKFVFSKLGKGTRRTLEGEMSVKLPFVGKIVETFLVNELTRNYEVEAEIQLKFYEKMLKKQK